MDFKDSKYYLMTGLILLITRGSMLTVLLDEQISNFCHFFFALFLQCGFYLYI